MRFRVQACSDKGRTKDHNEELLAIGDDYVCDGWADQTFEIPDEGNFQLLVASGIDGYGKGEEASLRLLEGINSVLGPDRRFATPFIFGVNLLTLCQRISSEFNEQAVREGQPRRVGCTLSGVIRACGRFWLVNCGDSRTYLFRDGALAQLSSDDVCRSLHRRGELEKCIGGGFPGMVSYRDVTDRLRDGDMVVICSDGLTDFVSVDEMEYILSNDFEPATALVERANDNGGTDNVSVIVAIVGGGEFAAGTASDESLDDDGRFDAWA